MHFRRTKWPGWVLVTLAVAALGCENESVGTCSVAIQTATCQSPQDCLDAILACAPTSGAKLSDFVCLRPTPSSPLGSCDTVSRLGPCPEQGCGCQACVKRVDLLCSNCGITSTCLSSSYCTELEPGDCDPPTTPIEVCRPVVVQDAHAGD